MVGLDAGAPMQVGTREVQEAVSDWFTQALGLKCWLVQQQAGSRQAVDREQLAAGVPSPAQSSLPEAALEPLDALQSRSIGASAYYQTPVRWGGQGVLSSQKHPA